MPYKVIDYKDIPNPIAKKILEEYVSKTAGYNLTAETARSALEYLQSLPKQCDYSKAQELASKLQEDFKLRDTTVALIINILPRTVDELRMLLAFETKVPDEGAQQKILELVKEYCG